MMRRNLTSERQRELEDLARNLLRESMRITPYQLADLAKVDFFAARGVLRKLASSGGATELSNGSFAGRAGK